MTTTVSVEDRFWAKVQGGDVSECWTWTATQWDGYGQFALEGKMVGAHRLAYELMIAEIPRGLTLDHLCRVRICVNPFHLDPVPQRINLRRGLVTRCTESQCANGHPWTKESRYVTRQGGSACRICQRIRDTRRRAANVALYGVTAQQYVRELSPSTLTSRAQF